MIQIPGKHTPAIKNRSSKNLYFLTRRGVKQMNEWHKRLGIPQYTAPRDQKKAVAKTEEPK